MSKLDENTTVIPQRRRIVGVPPGAHRIQRIDITHHSLPLDPPFPAAWDSRPRTRFVVSVVRVTTADGAVGIGSGSPMEGIGDYLDLLIGQDPLDLHHLSAVLANIDFHGCRPWPLEVALWDLAGKIRGQPVWRMLGGESGRVRCYASTGVLRDGKALAKVARTFAQQGFPAIKIRFHRADWRDDVRAVEAVRVAVGDKVELLVDCNQGWRMPWDTTPSWTYHQALAVARELKPLGVYWMEEPLHRGDVRGMAALRGAVGMRIAAGEMTREEHALVDLIDRRAVDVLQPDATLTCGISALARVAAKASAAGVMFTPHSWGNGIGLLANAHLYAGCGGGPWLEYPGDPPEWTAERRDYMLKKPLALDREASLTLPDAPGFGIELDEDRLAALQTA